MQLSVVLGLWNGSCVGPFLAVSSQAQLKDDVQVAQSTSTLHGEALVYSTLAHSETDNCASLENIDHSGILLADPFQRCLDTAAGAPCILAIQAISVTILQSLAQSWHAEWSMQKLKVGGRCVSRLLVRLRNHIICQFCIQCCTMTASNTMLPDKGMSTIFMGQHTWNPSQ
ncbi:unnamed protein product [Ostreobium quekettii]|uniref:Uncharacterized protein n=1 Tax=Ostreobium quekettii TaxID=121088 RepID=A0A8S1IKP5_9CHLO|nr:unnamed protein product [Ostreobium quekettii]